MVSSRASALLLFVAALAASGDARDIRVDAVFAKWAHADSPGCALGVIEDGQFVYQRGYGKAR